MPTDHMLTITDVMTALRLSRSKVYDLIRTKQLASTKIGRSRRVPSSALNAYMQHLIEEAA